ncbi:hypothetical protein Pint_12415 [Pistacia integerrima]|uniref:Uncharacterized protein n=1 Tax=Pistacia integerrima TaxID=434235 RepID=A0ACC0Y8G3_9ROSI|nr:hypothetical protein Pint_12415 [Pistacia integerrima]
MAAHSHRSSEAKSKINCNLGAMRMRVHNQFGSGNFGTALKRDPTS